jgi:hypothetical protein
MATRSNFLKRRPSRFNVSIWRAGFPIYGDTYCGHAARQDLFPGCHRDGRRQAWRERYFADDRGSAGHGRPVTLSTTKNTDVSEAAIAKNYGCAMTIRVPARSSVVCRHRRSVAGSSAPKLSSRITRSARCNNARAINRRLRSP